MKENKYLLPTGLLLLMLVLLTILFGEMAIYFLDLNRLIYKDLSEQLTLQQIEAFFENKKRWAWVGYLVMPVLLFLKITGIAWVLGIGGFFSDISLAHKRYFRIVLISEYIFLIPALVKFGWFYFVETDFSFDQVQQFVPFSLQSVFNTTNVPQWAMYPLQLINLFEVAYWLLLAYLIDKATRTTKGIKIVLTGYAPALFIWVVFIMFLTLNYTP
ncbi:hypothetical protein U1E44_13765 [Arenibacter sp. GZD96]|uniref:hypothetical protein n=1 Tax=Aurantibrevibacter litoralis TaxID=3106030 RepID=UPI002AFF2EBA|nr:hypothetical protein [Arenibacter sp. GZD-96]MEA1787163.1 hypothetical protein [Arenibacter sp. GZD-96]